MGYFDIIYNAVLVHAYINTGLCIYINGYYKEGLT